MTNIYYTINPISIGGNTIERVVVYKLLLGVYISNDLKWSIKRFTLSEFSSSVALHQLAS